MSDQIYIKKWACQYEYVYKQVFSKLPHWKRDIILRAQDPEDTEILMEDRVINEFAHEVRILAEEGPREEIKEEEYQEDQQQGDGCHKL